MRLIFEHWKYIFKNLWFVLPFAVVPALFLALSFDYQAIDRFLNGFFTGRPDFDFFDVFCSWSLLRFDSVLGAAYSVCMLVSVVFFLDALLAFSEKHMRIGKRTLSGVFAQMWENLLSTALIVLLYVALYELWALVLSAMLYTVSALGATAAAAVLFILIVALFLAVLLYVATIFYLWLPCIQITGMRAYNAFLYSYRLMTNVRGRLMLSMAISIVPTIILAGIGALMPPVVTGILMFFVVCLLFLSFAIRMEVLYFHTDKIEREDILRSYREL